MLKGSNLARKEWSVEGDEKDMKKVWSQGMETNHVEVRKFGECIMFVSFVLIFTLFIILLLFGVFSLFHRPLKKRTYNRTTPVYKSQKIKKLQEFSLFLLFF